MKRHERFREVTRVRFPLGWQKRKSLFTFRVFHNSLFRFFRKLRYPERTIENHQFVGVYSLVIYEMRQRLLEI